MYTDRQHEYFVRSNAQLFSPEIHFLSLYPRYFFLFFLSFFFLFRDVYHSSRYYFFPNYLRLWDLFFRFIFSKCLLLRAVTAISFLGVIACSNTFNASNQQFSQLNKKWEEAYLVSRIFTHPLPLINAST